MLFPQIQEDCGVNGAPWSNSVNLGGGSIKWVTWVPLQRPALESISVPS